MTTRKSAEMNHPAPSHGVSKDHVKTGKPSRSKLQGMPRGAITGHYVSVSGTRIYYEECGDGIPLVCIHTAGASSLEYYLFLPIMAKNGFRAIAIDLPGHGKSYPMNWRPFKIMHEYSEFVWKIIQAICHGNKPIVCGCSIGGEMVTDMACYHSEDMEAALALEGGAYPDPNTVGKYYHFGLYEDPHSCPGWSNFLERAAIYASYHPIPKGKEIELRWQHRYACQEIATGDLQCWVNHDCKDKLKEIKCPYLGLKGEADWTMPDEVLNDTVKRIPKGLAEAVIGKRMGHYPIFEQPEALADIVMDFLRRKKVVK